MADTTRRMRSLANAVKKFVGEEDSFGLKPREQLKLNARYEFLTSDRKLETFSEWLQQQIDEKLLSVSGGIRGKPWTSKYIQSAYQKGMVRAYVDSKAKALAAEPKIFDASKEQFLRDSFGQAETTSKIQLLATRAFEDMRGLGAQAKVELNRILADGVAHGEHPDEIARDMVDSIDGLSRGRANTIARTETIRAHSEGQLDSFQALGVTELGVQAEWSTAGDDSVCPLCEPLEGVTFTVDEARGMIPRHPNCRCTWIPSELDATNSPKEQRGAINDSVKTETGEDTVKAARAESTWSGADGP